MLILCERLYGRRSHRYVTALYGLAGGDFFPCFGGVHLLLRNRALFLLSAFHSISTLLPPSDASLLCTSFQSFSNLFSLSFLPPSDPFLLPSFDSNLSFGSLFLLLASALILLCCFRRSVLQNIKWEII